MNDLLESNERTLVLFDSVCSGLTSCLALVHADIKQMTEHRNRLVQLEQEQLLAKLATPHEPPVVTNNDDSKKTACEKKNGKTTLNRTSIFQVLLGKTTIKSGGNTLEGKKKKQSERENAVSNNTKELDNKAIIDDINRQTRLAMQYAKQLEAQLFKVEDLRSRYEMHLKMGLVVKSVAKAYLSSSGTGLGSSSSMATRSSLSSLNLSTWSSSRSKVHASHSSLKGIKISNPPSSSNSKATIKEFIENIDRIESEFETYMGTFLLAIEDIQGFARICQGDVFEIAIKYGEAQKFKTKVSVLKDNRQKCDNRQTVFKARIAYVLAIKAYECKGLGKRVLLGHKLCETRDLFTARSQLMTISLNQTGSIKLNLIVTWNPLHMTPNTSSATPGMDISHISLPPTPVSSSTLSSLSSVHIPPPDY